MYTFRQDFWIQLLLNLSRYIDMHVANTGHHSEQVAQWTRVTGRKMGCADAEIQATYWAALLHDIGKIGIPYPVLSKEGPLTRKEWKLMKLHPTIGSNIVQTLDSIAHVAPIISTHQEKYDGTGYPLGLRGNQIPTGARILALADAYDAITNDRFYRKARSHDEAVVELQVNKGTHFDPEILDVFLDTVNPIWMNHTARARVC